ncbi:MAG: phosphotransferase [Lentisphaeria bacterium]|nr:phosphotransferase [Lentisphaeria bacterium]
MTNSKASEAAGQFALYGDILDAEPYGNGHINDTYLLRCRQAGTVVRYILQRLNTAIFREPEKLMGNVSRVLAHCSARLAGQADASRRALTLVPAHDGRPFWRDAEGGCWRCYLFIEGAKSYDILETPAQAFAAAEAFGGFLALLADIGGERLQETIPHFHDTPSRLAAFDAALAADSRNRAALAKNEIAFVAATRHIAPRLLDLQAAGAIPERITHNDTKLNNVMLDDVSGAGICVIDLDTVMPGQSLFDFGDLVRTSVSPAAEDERDLRKVQLRQDVFAALVRGYLKGCDGCLTKTEVELLPFAGQLITFEIGLRFLTDFLQGDVYFKTHRDGHNLDRCRTQFRLVQLLREHEGALQKVVAAL